MTKLIHAERTPEGTIRFTHFTPVPKPTRKPKSRVPLPRPSKPVGRKAPLKKQNAKRAKANHARAYGEHADYIRSLPCCVCGILGYTVAAHTKTGGTSRKSDAKWLVPLCRNRWIAVPGWGYAAPVVETCVEGCHEESHHGIKTFEAKYGVDLRSVAAELWGERL